MYRLGLQLIRQSGREALLRLVVTSLGGRGRGGDTARRSRRVPRLPGDQQPAVVGVHPGATGVDADGALRAPSCGTTPRTSTRAASSSSSTWPRWVREHRASPVSPASRRRTVLRLAGAVPTAADRPADELGDRFPGQQAGLLGDAALSGPDELAIVVGYSPSQLAAVPGNRRGEPDRDRPAADGNHEPLPPGFRHRARSSSFPPHDPHQHRHPPRGHAARGTAGRPAAGRRDPPAGQRDRLGRCGRQPPRPAS